MLEWKDYLLLWRVVVVDQFEGGLAKKRVVRLGWAVYQSKGGLSNKRVVSLG